MVPMRPAVQTKCSNSEKNRKVPRKIENSIDDIKKEYFQAKLKLARFQLAAEKKKYILDMRIKKLQIKKLLEN